MNSKPLTDLINLLKKYREEGFILLLSQAVKIQWR